MIRHRYPNVPSLLIRAMLIGAGIYLFFANLNEPMTTYTDENRCYHFTMFSPLNYIFSGWATILLNRYDAPFYLMGFIGLANVLLLYWVFRELFSKEIALLGAAFLLVYDYHLSYAKILYYSMFETHAVLWFMGLYLLGVRKRNFFYLFLSGCALGFLPVIHISSFPIVAALLLFAVLYNRSAASMACILLGMILSVTAWFWYIQARYHHDSLLAFFKSYRQDMARDMDHVGRWMTKSITEWVSSSFASASQLFRNAFVLLSVACAWVLALKTRNKALLCLFVFLPVGFLLPFIACFFRCYNLEPKRYVWLSIFLAACFAHAFVYLTRLPRPRLRRFFIAAFAAYFALAAYQCVKVTQSLYSYDSIFNFLKEHGIRKRQIMTHINISRWGDFDTKQHAYLVPVVWAGDEMGYVIHWPTVYVNYRNGVIQYLMTSGYGGGMDTLGMNDRVLAGVRPMATWPHPSNNPYLFMSPKNIQIKLYRLSDVFSTRRD